MEVLIIMFFAFASVCWIAYLDYKDPKNRLDLAKEYFKQYECKDDESKGG